MTTIQDRPLLLQQFEVKGYKNLTEPIVFGPLGRINVVHGPNNVGKSNLLQAMDLFFRLLEKASSQQQLSTNMSLSISDFKNLGHPINEIVNLTEPISLEMIGKFSFTLEQQQQFGFRETDEIKVEVDFHPNSIQILIIHPPTEAARQAKQVNQKLEDILFDDYPFNSTERELFERLIKFSSTMRSYSLPTQETVSQFTLIGVNRRIMVEDTTPPSFYIVPQLLRDALFDAKESRDAVMVRRWELFVEAMKQFEPILGPGRFDTAFYREHSQADLVFDKGNVRIPVNLLGSGVQQVIALLGQLLLTPAPLVGIEEPELNLRYTLQKQLLAAFEQITTSEYGPQQLFLTSHSPAFEAEEFFFAMDLDQNGAPTLTRRPRQEARLYTGTRDEEDQYIQMHAQRSEPVCYVSGEGLVLLPEDVRQQLNLQHGGGVSFVPSKETGRFELWTTDEIEQWLEGGSHGNNAG